MTQVETRQLSRDSLFLMARVRAAGGAGGPEFRVKVRNLSTGGMMADGATNVARGDVVYVELRNIGWVEGSVAWKQDNRFGIAFSAEIDPKLARGQVSGQADLDTPRFVRPPLKQDRFISADKLRKI